MSLKAHVHALAEAACWEGERQRRMCHLIVPLSVKLPSRGLKREPNIGKKGEWGMGYFICCLCAFCLAFHCRIRQKLFIRVLEKAHTCSARSWVKTQNWQQRGNFTVKYVTTKVQGQRFWWCHIFSFVSSSFPQCCLTVVFIITMLREPEDMDACSFGEFFCFTMW